MRVARHASMGRSALSTETRPVVKLRAETPVGETQPGLDLRALAAAQAAVESLETKVPTRRANTRAATEPRGRFARGTSCNDVFETSGVVLIAAPDVETSPF